MSNQVDLTGKFRLSLVLAVAQSELWTKPKGSRQTEPKVLTEPWLRPNEKFNFLFLAHLQLNLAYSKVSATD